RQLERLLAAHLTFERYGARDGRQSRAWLHMPVAKAGRLWWDEPDEERTPLWGSSIILNDEFFQAILARPVPLRMQTLLALKKSPLALDLYAWVTYESAKAQHHRRGRFVAWSLLRDQFGTELGRLDNFVAKAKRALGTILRSCPRLKLACARGG